MQIDNFKIEDWFNKYEKLSRYDMADTCVESLSLNELFNIIGDKNSHLEYISNKKLNYGDIQGSEKLINAIRTLYKKNHPITITHGAIGANSLVLKSVVEKGDKVVVILPIYQQHYSIPKSIGANVKYVFLKEENNWIVDTEELSKVVGNDTKLICMNNPNNPTGSVIQKNTLIKIAEIGKKSGSYILCDEVYRGLEHSGKGSPSIVDIYERGISTSSMSKVFSLAGLRLGWIAAPKEIMKKIIIHREYDTISVSALDDYFATLAIENKSKIIKRNLNIIKQGKKILSDWIKSESHISWVEPNGGTTALLKYDLPIKSVDLCTKLLNDTGILFLPGFALEMEGYLRVGYCGDLKNLETGLYKFSDWLKNNH